MDNSVMDNNVSEMSQPHVEPSAQIEKMIPQSQVNEIVGSAKREAAERAVEAYKRSQSQSATQQNQQSQEQILYRGTSEDDIKRVAGDEIKKHFSQIEQEAQERAHLDAANRIVGMFRDKVVAGKDKFEDFDSVTSNVAMQRYPNVVQLLAEHVDNTADVLYHLAKNRDKLYRLEALSEHSSGDAVYEIKRLADSIKSNEESAQSRNPNAPLSQQRPSNTSAESGVLSMADLKRKYRA